MVHYKLIYSNSRGFAEAARQILVLAEVPFEDVRIQFGDRPAWRNVKKTTPFGQLPVLEIDTEKGRSFQIPQSSAITRYLARKYGYAGRNLEEEAWADAIVDQYKDFSLTYRDFAVAQRLKSAEEVATIRAEISEPGRDAYFKILNKILTESKSGYLVGDGLTWADLVVADNLTSLEITKFFKRSEEPKLDEFHRKITSTPKLKEWIEKRPFTRF